MRKVLLAGALALAGLTALPERSHAWGRDAYNSHGFTWLQSFAFRKMQWIHQTGPLYNYGPYDGPGHQATDVKIPWHGVYIPADPNIGAYGSGYGGGYAAPGYAPAPTSAPPPGQPQPATLHGRQAVQPTPQQIVPAAYRVYPAWLNYR